ncbi:MAG: hypothetical protein AB8B83_09385 [Bdellovibrionales bacterium]
MNKIVKQWIIDAFSKAAAYSSAGNLLIDLQDYETRKKGSFQAAQICADFSQNLRKHGIKNLWVGMPFVKAPWQRYTLSEFLNSQSTDRVDLFKIAKPSENEFIYIKQGFDAFSEEGPLHDDTKNFDLLFACGLNAMACLPHSVIGALRSTKANIIVLKDGTNGNPDISVEEHKRVILSFASEEERTAFSKRLMVSDTKTVKQILEEINQPPVSQHHKDHQPPPQPHPHHRLPPSHE